MKVAFITFGEARDIKNWSGVINKMVNLMEYKYSDVVVIDKIEKYFNPVIVFFIRMLQKLFRRSFQYERIPLLLKILSRRLESILRLHDFNFLFSPSSIPFSYLHSKVPKVFWTDATFAIMINYYPDYYKLPAIVKDWGNKQEQLALLNVDLAIYASDWAYQSAVNDYHISPAKVKMIPMGANLEKSLSQTEILEIVENRLKDDTIRLLSIGTHWQRKGFDVTLQVAQEVYNMGYKVDLALVGALPPREIKVPFGYRHYGRLSKSNPSEFETYQRLYKEAHFFVLPSYAECFGVVFAEASSFALPSLARRTGGIPSMVEDEVNGFTFDLNTPALDYAKKIVQFFNDKALYKQLCNKSFSKFTNELDWAKGFGLFTAAISDLVKTDSERKNKSN